MAEADWTFLANSLDAASVARGVTHGIARPPGGGNFCYGMNSKVNTPGSVGLYTNQTNFAPMVKGGSVRGAVQRGASGGPLNFAAMLFMSLQGNQVSDLGYLLGLSDDDPHYLVLRKGKVSEGLPTGAPGSSGVLRRSVETHVPGTWLHLRLDVIANPSGDVILKCFKNDLTVVGASVVTPNWQAVTGLEDYVDDALGVNSGSPPYVGGYAGFGMQVKDVTRRVYFDHLEVLRQLNP